MPAARAGQRTYWHLLDQRRRPSPYEIGSSRLLYHPARGFAVELPLSAWYARWQRGSALQADDWEAFADPRACTYSEYVARQAAAEEFAAGLLLGLEQSDAQVPRDPRWLALVEASQAPLRYALHGFQMAAAYIGQMAPASRITIVAAFQAADHMRRIQGLARRLGQLRARQAGFGQHARAHWQTHPAWQPLRSAVETLLATYDWGEATIALELCLEPWVDALLLLELARLARAGHEPLLAPLLDGFDADGRWHLEWASALVELSLLQRPGGRPALAGLWTHWNARGEAAVQALVPLFVECAGAEAAGHALEMAAERQRLLGARLGLLPEGGPS